MSAADEKEIAKGNVVIALAGIGLLRRNYDKLNRLIWLQSQAGPTGISESLDAKIAAGLEDDVDATLEKIEKLEPQVADEIVEAAVAVARAIRADARDRLLYGPR